MMTTQILARNIRSVIPWRRFSSAPGITEKVNAKVTKKNSDNQTETPTSKSSSIFSKLRSIDSSANGTSADNEPKPQISSPAKSSKASSKLFQNINDAKTVNELLELSTRQSLSQQQAMKIVSKLSTLTASNEANVKEFENDYRFLKVCRLLSKETAQKSVVHSAKSIELEMVLSVAGDEEAIKIIESYTLSQKVRVLSQLARKKTRSVPVLKSLASSISSHTGKLNLKECSDILYAVIALSFMDEVLLSRVAIDINRELSKNKDKTAVVGSIVTSLGYLRYKEPTLLGNLSKWIINNQDLCRPKDLASLLLTLALVNCRTDAVDEIKSKILPKIARDDLTATEWLDYVWALCVLDLQQSHHLKSILEPDFLDALSLALQGHDVNPAQKMKILNINAVAKHLTPDYGGPYVQDNSPIANVSFPYRKSKLVMVNGLLDTLKNLFTAQSYIRTEYDTKMGVIIDAECVLNDKRIPLAVESEHKNGFRIAFLVLDFHDMCKGQTTDPNGYAAIAIKLLKCAGYNILLVPHNEFSTSEKVLKRVQYLDAKLKEIVQQQNLSDK